MRDDLFAQQLAQQQWILPSALCSSERWKLLPHNRVMVRQPSAPLREASHSRVKQPSFPVAAEALMQRGWWGKKDFRTCRDRQGSPRAEGITYLRSMMHAVIASLPHLQSSFSWASKFTHHNGVIVWLWNFCRREQIPMDLYHELAPGSYHPNAILMQKEVITSIWTQLASGTWINDVVMQATRWGPARGIWQWYYRSNISMGNHHCRYTWNSSKVQENGILSSCWEH